MGGEKDEKRAGQRANNLFGGKTICHGKLVRNWVKNDFKYSFHR